MASFSATCTAAILCVQHIDVVAFNLLPQCKLRKESIRYQKYWVKTLKANRIFFEEAENNLFVGMTEVMRRWAFVPDLFYTFGSTEASNVIEWQLSNMGLPSSDYSYLILNRSSGCRSYPIYVTARVTVKLTRQV